MMIPIVGPFGLEAAHHAHMGALTPRTELLCGIDCEDDRLVATRAGTVFAISSLKTWSSQGQLTLIVEARSGFCGLDRGNAAFIPEVSFE
jgi:hypothetical protein